MAERGRCAQVVQGVLLLVGRGKGWRRWPVLIASDLGRLDEGAMKRHADSYVTTSSAQASSSKAAVVAEGARWQDWDGAGAQKLFSARCQARMIIHQLLANRQWRPPRPEKEAQG